MYITNGKVAWEIPCKSRDYYKQGPVEWDTSRKWYIEEQMSRLPKDCVVIGSVISDVISDVI